jgi:hypothetical protein
MRVFGPALDVFIAHVFLLLGRIGNARDWGNDISFRSSWNRNPSVEWHAKDAAVDEIKRRYRISEQEIHTGFMARRFPEQEQIAGFAMLSHPQRIAAMRAAREGKLIRVAALRSEDNLKKTYARTAGYVHLTLDERRQLLRDVADLIGSCN